MNTFFYAENIFLPVCHCHDERKFQIRDKNNDIADLLIN